MKLLILALTANIAMASFGPGVKVTADKVMAGKPVSTLLGNAKLEQGDHKLLANKIEMNGETGVVVATGEVTYEDGKTSLKDSAMKFKIDEGHWTLVKQTR